MKTRDYIIIGGAVLAAWWLSSDNGQAQLAIVGLGGAPGGAGGAGGAGAAGGTGATGSSSQIRAVTGASGRPAPGQITNPGTLDSTINPRDVAVSSGSSAPATHYPYIGQAGVDTRNGRAVFFNGGNWDYGTYNPALATAQSQQPSAEEHILYKYDPNAPDATGENAYIRTSPGTVWSGRNPAVSP